MHSKPEQADGTVVIPGTTERAGLDPDGELVVIPHGAMPESSEVLVDDDLTADRTRIRVECGFEPATD